MRPASQVLKDFVPRYALVTIVTLAIVYGSLYPFRARDPGSLVADLLHLASTWRQPPQGRGDMLANLLLYMPFGLSFMLALRREKWSDWLWAVGAGAALSGAIELTQFYDETRVSCLSDVYLNILGTFGGCVLARAGGASLLGGWWRAGSAAAFARLLLLSWLGWRLFPYVPTIDMHKYWRSLKPLLSADTPPPFDVLRYAVLWLSVAFLLRAGLRTRYPGLIFLLAVAGFFAARILIVDQTVSELDLAGSALALVLAPLLFGRLQRFTVAVLAIALTGVMLMTRLLPWQFAPAPKHFQWIPFFSFLHGSLQVDVISFAEKFYLYGAVIALAVSAGVRLRTVVALECAILLSSSILQMFMVRRSAEVTDAVLALALGAIFAILRRRDAAMQTATGAR